MEPVNSVIFLSSRVSMEKSTAGSECRGILFFALVDFIASRAEFPPRPQPPPLVGSWLAGGVQKQAVLHLQLLFFSFSDWPSGEQRTVTA